MVAPFVKSKLEEKVRQLREAREWKVSQEIPLNFLSKVYYRWV
jgi:hypothetical protein